MRGLKNLDVVCLIAHGNPSVFFFSRLTQAGSCAISLFSLAFDDICDLLLKIKDVERNGVFVGSTMVLWSISQLLTCSL